MMKVISHYSCNEDALITSVVINYDDRGTLVQEAVFDIIDSGKCAVLKSNKFHAESESVIRNSFNEIVNALKKYDVNG